MNIFVTNATQSVNWVGTGCAGFPSVLLKRCCCCNSAIVGGVPAAAIVGGTLTPPFLPALPLFHL